MLGVWHCQKCQVFATFAGIISFSLSPAGWSWWTSSDFWCIHWPVWRTIDTELITFYKEHDVPSWYCAFQPARYWSQIRMLRKIWGRVGHFSSVFTYLHSDIQAATRFFRFNRTKSFWSSGFSLYFGPQIPRVPYRVGLADSNVCVDSSWKTRYQEGATYACSL